MCTGVTVHKRGAAAARAHLVRLGPDELRVTLTDSAGRAVATVDSLVTMPAPVLGHLYEITWRPATTTVDVGEYELFDVARLDPPEDMPGRVRHLVTATLERVRDWVSRDRPGRLVVLAGDDPAGAAVAGFVRSAQSEHPDRIVLVDGPASAVDAALRTGEPQVAIRAGVPMVPRLVIANPTGAAPALDPDGTVLITGGTGALGASLARYLVAEHGVRHLVLASRSGRVPAWVTDLPARVVACDVSDRAAVDALVASCRPTAVFHLAGVVSDGVVDGMTAQRVAEVLAPKVDGAWHLHEATKDLGLSAFVLYSSAAGVLGRPGQSNYAAANGFLDALARHRVANGLPAQSLAWGPWSTVDDPGMAGRTDPRQLGRGVRSVTEREGVELLDAALRTSAAVLVPVPLDLRVLAGSPLFADLAASGPPESSVPTSTDNPTAQNGNREPIHPPNPNERDSRAPGGPPVSILPETTDNSMLDGERTDAWRSAGPVDEHQAASAGGQPSARHDQHATDPTHAAAPTSNQPGARHNHLATDPTHAAVPAGEHPGTQHQQPAAAPAHGPHVAAGGQPSARHNQFATDPTHAAAPAGEHPGTQRQQPAAAPAHGAAGGQPDARHAQHATNPTHTTVPAGSQPDARHDQFTTGPTHAAVPAGEHPGTQHQQPATDPAHGPHVVAVGEQPGAWRDHLATVPSHEREAVLAELIRAELAAVLGFPNAAALPTDRPLTDLGFDSLTGLQVRNRLSAFTRVRLAATIVLDHPTLPELAAHIHAALRGELPEPPPRMENYRFSTVYHRVLREQGPLEAMALRYFGSYALPSFSTADGQKYAVEPRQLASGNGTAFAFIPSYLTLYNRMPTGLARQFYGERDLFLVDHPGFGAQRAVPDNVATLVRTLADTVRALSKDLVLVGHCAGGAIAHAVARHLANEGRSPAGLVLLDTHTGLLRRDDARGLALITAGASLPDDVVDEFDDSLLIAGGGYARVLEDWRPEPSPVPTLMVRGRPTTDMLRIDPDRDWRPHWPLPHEVADVPGDNYSVVHHDAGATAAAIRAWLNDRRV
jgi:hypothetical protein